MQRSKKNLNQMPSSIASSSNSTHRDYWLVFGASKHWACKFLKRGYEHVFIVMRDRYGWTCINPCSNTLKVDTLPFLLNFDVPTLYVKQGYRVARISVGEYRKRAGRHGLKFITCVWIVKYYLGLCVKAYTPWGLYKALAKASQNYRQTGIRFNLLVR